jgi:hypothetical protein
MNNERPLKRTRNETVGTRKRKAAVLEEPIYLTPMEIDVRPPFIFYPIPVLKRADANAMDN